ncbi:glycoside hydrolase family 93 protein [Apiospora hydei]|uniref:Glycoside hydrolase family 93 protein n=1 Tax=Apiospora hydei TaxID=1337664 RepID=A0ABR1W9U8_9PEZI
MLLPLLKAAAFAAVLGTSAPSEAKSLSSRQKPEPWGFFTNNTIYQTTGRESITYPRYAALEDGTILATASLSGQGGPGYFPIFESTDGGASWEQVSNLTDTVNGWGLSAQPALTELTEEMGGFPAGTILGSGNSWSNNGTRIDLVYDHQLVCYYSDQRDPLHGQKLAHQTSPDLRTWGPVVNDVTYDLYEARPGMTVVAYLPDPVDQWILVHERPIGNSSSHGVHYPVYYVMADSPLEFGQAVGRPIVVNNQTAPNASPYVVWSPAGGTPYGTIVVSDADRRQVYTNRYGGDPDRWEEHGTPAGAVYSRAIQILEGYPDHLLIYGGETFDDMGLGLHTPFSATVVDLEEVLTMPVDGYDD